MIVLLDHQGLEEGDDGGAGIIGELLIGTGGWRCIAAMGPDYLVKRCQIATMAIGCCRADAPEFGGHEHIPLDKPLGEQFVSES